MLDHRLQILVDERRYHKLESLARRRGISIAELVRTAIDELTDPDAERRNAIESFLAAPSISVPEDPADLRRELDEAHDRLPR